MRFLGAAGLIMILAGLGARYTTGEHSIFSVANLLVGPLALLAAGAIELRRFRGFTGALSRRVVLRWGMVVAAVTLAVIGANWLAAGWNASLDWTVQQQYTLSDQTEVVCAEIARSPQDRQPRLLFFEDSRIAKDFALRVAAYQSDCGIQTHELTRAEAPPEAREILNSYETTVVACLADRCEPVGYPSEENITNALLRLARTSQPVVYFVVGHGESNLASYQEHGTSGLSGTLRNLGLDVRAYLGPARPDPPSDADLIILVAPERNLMEGELAGIQAYLEGGGRMLVMLEPGVHSNLEQLLERWGFELPARVVADSRTSPLLEEPEPISLIANGFSTWHAVTRKMNVRTPVLMPSARPVRPARKPAMKDRLSGLVFSSRTSWIETDVHAALAGQSISADPDETSGQEIPLAAAGIYPRDGGEARIVVIGDRDFASNRLLGVLYNRDLFVGSVLWLADEEERVAISPKGWTPHQHPLALQQSLAYFYFLAFALPEALLLLGIHAWYRQRQ
jgi:hypothetical protein